MRASLQKTYGHTGPYGQAGFAVSREDVFYYPVILGFNRFVNWLWARDDVDRTRFSVFGGSQGGYLSLAIMALNPHFTRGVAYVPAMGDNLGELEGRDSGWPKVLTGYPKEKWDAVRAIAPYFDAIHFASRVTTPIHGVRGLADTTCPPTATKRIFDAIASKEKDLRDIPDMPHKVHPELERELEAWARAGQAGR